MVLKLRDRAIDCSRHVLIVGEVRVDLNLELGNQVSCIHAAVEHARDLVRDGADIIEVGLSGEKLRSEGRDIETEVRIFEELFRLLEVTVPVAVRISCIEVARRVVPKNGDVLVYEAKTGFSAAAGLCMQTGATFVLAFSTQNAHEAGSLDGLFELGQRGVQEADLAGLRTDFMAIDPGDGSKSTQALKRWMDLKRPLWLSISPNDGTIDSFNAESVAAMVHGWRHGVRIFGVRNAPAARAVVRLLQALDVAACASQP